MIAYIVRRLLQGLLVMFLVSVIVVLLTHSSGDPVRLMLPGHATQEDVLRLRHALGLDQPIYVQYCRYIGGIVRGDFGKSLLYRLPNIEIFLDRVPATLQLTVAAMALALAVALPTGIISAVRRNSWIDYLSRVFAVIGQAIPFFWLGIMLILIFAVTLKFLPTSGRGDLKHLILPSLTLSTYPMARIARLLRSSLLDVLGEDYLRTARSKGLAERRVILDHALSNALLPVVTVVGLEFGNLLGGAVITETIFAWPGVGRLAIDAVSARDYPLIQTIVLASAFTFVLINLVVDILYAYLDPRIRYR